MAIGGDAAKLAKSDDIPLDELRTLLEVVPGMNALEAMSVEPDDFDEASDALLELERRDRQRAAAVSRKILEDGIGDVFYRACAFEVLYSAAPGDAVDYIEAHARTAEV